MPKRKQGFELAQPRKKATKLSLHVRIDPQVVSWLRSKATEQTGYLTLINDILHNVMEAEVAQQ